MRSMSPKSRLPKVLLLAGSVLAFGILTTGYAVGELSPGPAARPLAADDGRPRVTFAGFHVFESGRSRIFVKLTGDVPVEAKHGGKKAAFVLRGASVGVRNNKNPLLTQHFASSVLSARLVPSDDAVTLSVVLRDSVTPSHRVARHQDGSVTVHFDFPAPSLKSGKSKKKDDDESGQ